VAYGLISPKHKRTEGRAPEWGSEFTTKVATLQGDSSEIAPTLNVELWDLVAGGRVLPLFWNSLFFWYFLLTIQNKTSAVVASHAVVVGVREAPCTRGRSSKGQLQQQRVM
jgi:hypothetical protein